MRLEEQAGAGAARPTAVPRRAGDDAHALGEARRRAARRLRRLLERQAADGDPVELRSPPARILALFR